MKYTSIRLFKTFFIFLLFNMTATAQPLKKDYYRTAIELSLFLAIEYDLFDIYSIQKKSSQKPNRFDNAIRNKLIWSESNLNAARFGSDILLYGVVLGSIPIAPLLLKENHRSMILTNLEVLAINGLITDVTKYLVGRQRPSSYFNTRDEKKDAFKSFFSGHTSTSFAIATSTAMILSKEFSSQKKLIWASSYTTAAITGYLRIAADKHYFTDVLAGALSGSLTGYFTYKLVGESYISVNTQVLNETSKRLSIAWQF